VQEVQPVCEEREEELVEYKKVLPQF